MLRVAPSARTLAEAAVAIAVIVAAEVVLDDFWPVAAVALGTIVMLIALQTRRGVPEPIETHDPAERRAAVARAVVPIVVGSIAAGSNDDAGVAIMAVTVVVGSLLSGAAFAAWFNARRRRSGYETPEHG